MSRIYTELRIAHRSQEEKQLFEKQIDEQSRKLLGHNERAEYIRQIVNLDAATGIIETLKKSDK